MSGSITERPLADGRAEVRVILHTTNALTFAVDDPEGTFDFTGPLLFGQRLEADPGNCGLPPAQAALGNSHLNVTFTNTAPGAQLPDLIQLLVAPEDGQQLLSLKFRGQASGLIPDEADGTPGRVEVTQTGLLSPPLKSKPLNADGFPAEKIIIRAIGQ
jgi:hypothetical protein